MKTNPLSRGLLAASMVAAFAACTGRDAQAPQPQTASGVAVEQGQPAPDSLQLERVVMLMRHGVRPPTRAKVLPDGLYAEPWPEWPVDYGLLTPRGFEAVRLLGEWDRSHWVAQGLLPAEGCPGAGEIEVAASAKQRTQETARALAEGMLPGCRIDVAFPASEEADVEFHPLDVGAVAYDPATGLSSASGRMPEGGMDEEVRRNADLFALLNHALGCCTGESCSTQGKKECDLSAIPAGLALEEGTGELSVGAPFSLASTAAQTFLLQYLEGMPMADVAWGRLSREQIGELLRFHTFKYSYETRTPYIAAYGASPLARRMLDAMEDEDGPKLTVLVGHDTNIAMLGGFLDLHWELPDYPDDDPPPGGALGFEVLSDAAGTRYVRAFYRAQTMDQVRELQSLDAGNAPAYVHLDIPGCDDPCRLDTFAAGVRPRLVPSLRDAREH